MNKVLFQCFMGHVFSREQIDDLRGAIRDAFQDCCPQACLWFADDYLGSKHILDKISDAIDKSDMCMFELSHLSKPNVFVELGYAIAKSKKYVLLVKKGLEVPSDLAGLDRIEYESFKELRDKLKKYLPQVIRNAVGTERLVGDLDMRVFRLLPDTPLPGSHIDLDKLKAQARAAGVTDSQFREIAKFLEDRGFVVRSESEWIITDSGVDPIGQLVTLSKACPQ